MSGMRAIDERSAGDRKIDGQMMDENWAAIYERTLDCVHCGLCLPVCPTYRETGRENSSPRGRIYMLRAVAENRVPLSDVISEETYLCLGCRACETACPSGVKFGSMLELARAEIDRSGLRRGWPVRLERWALRRLVANPQWLSLAISPPAHRSAPPRRSAHRCFVAEGMA